MSRYEFEQKSPSNSNVEFSEHITPLPEQKEKVRDIPVTIVIPPSPFLADERVFPFLGPLKVAAELSKNGNQTNVLDLSGYSNYLDIVRQYANENQDAVYGITATTPQIPTAASITQAIKDVSSQSTVILGGPHATLTHAAFTEDAKTGRKGRGTHAFMQLTNLFDRIVSGDGEESIFYAIDPDQTQQVIDSSTTKSPLFLQKGTLESFEHPARHLIDLDSYHYSIDGRRAFSVIGQLGCPFECGFCGGRDSQVFRIARTRDINDVIREIESVVTPSLDTDTPYGGVMFYDDELNVSPSNLEKLCTGLIDMQDRLGHEMRFRGFVKAELFTPEQARLMYQAGFKILLSGVESGSDRILSVMKKHTSRAINSRCVETAHNAGLSFKALMSIGHPGESETTIGESIEWVTNNLSVGDDVDWTIITQYPGSPYFDHSVYVPEKNAWLYEMKNKKNGEVARLWSSEVDYLKEANYYKGVPGEYTAFVWTDYLNAQELVQLREIAEGYTREKLQLNQIGHNRLQQFEHSMGQSLPSQILKRG